MKVTIFHLLITCTSPGKKLLQSKNVEKNLALKLLSGLKGSLAVLTALTPK